MIVGCDYKSSVGRVVGESGVTKIRCLRGINMPGSVPDYMTLSSQNITTRGLDFKMASPATVRPYLRKGLDVLVRDVRNVAKRWVSEEASGVSNFGGAIFSGSIVEMADDAMFPATSKSMPLNFFSSPSDGCSLASCFMVLTVYRF